MSFSGGDSSEEGEGTGNEMKKVELFRAIECAQAVKSSELRCQRGGPVDYNF